MAVGRGHTVLPPIEWDRQTDGSHHCFYPLPYRRVIKLIIILIIIIMWLACDGRCRSYERAPCLSILRSVIGSCQANVEWSPRVGNTNFCELDSRYIRLHSAG